MDFKKILFVTKFNDLSFNALQSFLCLRKAALDHIVLTNVIEREKVSMHRGLGYQKSEEIRLRETANIRFIDWAESLFEQGLEVGVYIVVGNLVRKVIEAVRKEEADLIVIGRSRQRFLEQLYSGSHVTELIRQSVTPVMVYKPPSDKIDLLDKPFARPLLATDWSPACLRAVEYLMSLKAITQKVILVHVTNDKELKGSAMEIQKVRKTYRARLDGLVERFEAGGMNAEAHLYIGDAAEEIEKAAQEHQASTIVLGSSGMSAWRERWLGSVPQTIAEKSEYPTLIIPPPKPAE